MKSLHIRNGLGAAAVATALLLVGACGSGGNGDAGSPDSPQSSASTSTDAGSSSPGADSSASTGTDGSSADQGSTAVLTSANIGQAMTAALKKAGSFSFRINSSAGGQDVTADGAGSYDGDRPLSRTRMTVAGQKLEIVVADGVYYLKSPLLRTDKPWLKIDPDAKSGLGALVGQMGGAGDPTSSMQALYGASKVDKLGEATIDGVQTTHYQVLVPRSALAKAMNYPKQMVSMLPGKIHYDVWVDSADRPRQMTTKLKIAGKSSTTRITMDDFGKPVTIKAPPADQVTTKSALSGVAG